MGNRATVIFTDGNSEFSPAVYLHWNGGPESVYAFLHELERRQVRADQDYECARFIQIVGDFFDSGDAVTSLSLGVANGPTSNMLSALAKVRTDKSDNGIYLVNRTVKPMQVRRYLLDWDACRAADYKKEFVKEMTRAEVEAEYREAIGHKFFGKICDTLAGFTEGKTIQGG